MMKYPTKREIDKCILEYVNSIVDAQLGYFNPDDCEADFKAGFMKAIQLMKEINKAK